MPCFVGRESGEVVMRTHRVVPDLKLAEQMHKRITRADLDPIQLLLERPEQTLDPAVHPGATRYAELLFDPGQATPATKNLNCISSYLCVYLKHAL